MTQSSDLNDPIRIGTLNLPNRVFMAPLTRARTGAFGIPAPLNATYYAQRSSAGLIIAEATNVGPLSCAFEQAPGIWNSEQVAGWRTVTEAVHAGGGHIFLQLWHGGRVSAKGLLDGQEPVSPSGVNDDLDHLEVWAQLANGHYVKIRATPSRALSVGEVEGIVEEYRIGSVNALSAGFDGVEFHAANGYLPHQFLSSETNRRSDKYGGSPENRSRFLKEIVSAALTVFPAAQVGVRLSPYAPYNHAIDANSAETYRYVAGMLNGLSVGYLHLSDNAAFSGGTPMLPQILEDVRPHYAGKVIVNGGLTPKSGASLLKSGSADAVAFGRMFIANPDLPARIETGAPLEVFDYATAYGGDEHGYTDYPTYGL